MAEFPGYLPNPIIENAVSSPPDVSIDLSKLMLGAPTLAISAIPESPSGVRTDQLGVVVPMTYGGSLSLMHGQVLFEKIIVEPRLVELDCVLKDITWHTSVWNTHGEKHATLAGINIINNDGISVETPESLPMIFGAGRQRSFEMLAGKKGGAVIDALIVFEFSGIQGANQRVTGTRIIIEFAPGLDWSEIVCETTQYLTDVLTSYTAKEQRFALRKNPRTKLKFLFSPVSKRESAALEALIYAGGQSGLFSVPFWPDAQKITEHALPGDTEIFFDTSNRKFTGGGIFSLWRRDTGHEFFKIEAVFHDRIRLIEPLEVGFPNDGQTYAVPAMLGRWEGDAELERLNPWINGITAEFLLEPMPDVPPGKRTQAYGCDVLEIHPNAAAERRSLTYERTIQKIDFNTGKFTAFDRSGSAISKTKGFLWTMHGRAEIAAFRAFFAARKGRLVPFRVPSWQHDLELAAPVRAQDTTVVIKNTWYATYQFQNPARRHLCFILMDGSGRKIYRKVIDAVEDNSTETLKLDSPPGATLTPDTCMVSFLNLVRLASDSVELVWITNEVAEAELEFVEVLYEL